MKETRMKPVSASLAATPPSGIRALMRLAAEYPDAIHLEVGDPNFPTPASVIEAALADARAGHTKYTPNRGIPELRAALVDKLWRKNRIRAAADDIVLTCGAVSAIMESLNSLVDPGDAVLLPGVCWPNYELMAHALNAEVRRYPLRPETGFQPDLDALAELLAQTPRAKVLLLNSPANPTGAVLPRATLQRMLELARAADVYVISDEVYEEFVFSGEHYSPASQDPDGRVISVYSFSKTYAMTGWRLGYLHAAPALAELISKVQEAHTSCASAVAQRAALAALRADQQVVTQMRDAYQARRDVAATLLRQAGMLIAQPEGAFYIMADISGSGLSSDDYCRQLLAQQRVAVAPGRTFGPGCDGFVRISLASALPDIQEGIARMTRFRPQPSKSAQ
jgi:aspartate aminotransferase/aminotransferase